MDVILYNAEDGKVQLEVHLEKETVWLTQDQMADLFGRERSVITKHLRNVFKEGELEEASVRAKFAHTADHGSKLIAESRPRDKETIVKVIVSLINRANV